MYTIVKCHISTGNGQVNVLKSEAFIIFVLSIGHIAFIFSHGSMQFTWNKCRHFLIIRTSSFTLKFFQHTQHYGYFSRSYGKSWGLLLSIVSIISWPVWSSSKLLLMFLLSSFFACLLLDFSSLFLHLGDSLSAAYSCLKFSAFNLNFLSCKSI